MQILVNFVGIRFFNSFVNRFFYCSLLWPVTIFANPLLPGGAGSVNYLPVQPLLLPAANLANELKPNFFAGKALAEQPWVKAPTITAARDGLGPIYNARSCFSCHARGERGRLPENPSQGLHAAIVKISIPGLAKRGGSVPEPIYGSQLQTQSISLLHQFRQGPLQPAMFSQGEVSAEADIRLQWRSEVFTYPDGTQITLRRPQLDVAYLGYGGLHSQAILSLRNTPVIYGVGLLDSVADEQILAWADPEDSNHDGISGRANRVWNYALGQYSLGRFGWKASRPDVSHITAAAFAQDIGITNPLFPQPVCTKKQTACGKASLIKTGSDPELSQALLDLTVHFVRNIAVPKVSSLTDSAQEGQVLFDDIGCARCHRPYYRTATVPAQPQLSQQAIWPYSDLLLHDMGEGLADHFSEYDASGREWRTPPLWGLARSPSVLKGAGYLLHDGRAQTIEQAVIWHGGEAETAKQRYVQLKHRQRSALLEFLESI